MMARRIYPGTVAERLARKLEVLQRFCKEGVPPGVEVPRTLGEFAMWRDEGLGLHPVASPNDVATTHPTFGELAERAQDAINKLNTKATRGERSKRPTLSEENARFRDELARSHTRERMLMGQFHMKDAVLDRMQREAASMDARIRHLSEQNQLLTQRIHDLEAVRVVHVSAGARNERGRDAGEGSA